MLLRNGHNDIMSYRFGFLNIALDEMGDYTINLVKNNALAHRLSKLDNDEFSKYMKEDATSDKASAIKVDHKAQMQQAKG